MKFKFGNFNLEDEDRMHRASSEESLDENRTREESGDTQVSYLVLYAIKFLGKKKKELLFARLISMFERDDL